MGRTVPARDPAGFQSNYPVPPDNIWEQHSYPRSLYTAGEKHWKSERLTPFLRVLEETHMQSPNQWQNFSPEEPKQPNRISQEKIRTVPEIRCRTEYENAYQYFGGDIPKLIRAMSYSADSIVRCYSVVSIIKTPRLTPRIVLTNCFLNFGR